MAGVAILMGYLFYGFAALLVSCVTAVILVVVSRAYLPQSVPGRKSYLRGCAWTPFLGCAWVLLTWIVYSNVLELVFHRDNGMTTDLHAPMPNGYMVGNVSYSFGYLLGPGESRRGYRPTDGPNSVASILYLQESEPYLLGSRFLWNHGGVERANTDKPYFLIDTRTRQILRFDTIEDLISTATARGLTVSFSPNWTGWCWKAYQKYRPIWFDRFFPLVSLLGLAWLFGSLIWEGRRLRMASLQSRDAP